MSELTPLLVIVGETASGKSDLAIKIAQKYKGEIIAADSWTVYQELDIGTAKPSDEECRLVNHHLIDVVLPSEDFTAAEYKHQALKAITDIASRAALPILVGGTGLYIDSVIFDYSFLPPANNRERNKLEKMTGDELVARAVELGYDLSEIDVKNKRRVRRLIETKGAKPTKSSMRENTLVIGLRISRSQLRARIEQRVELMFKRGLRREVEELVARYGWNAESMKGIGYWEFKAYFDGQQSLSATKRKIIRNTLNLAKRQRTWFKRNTLIKWVENLSEAELLVEKFLKSQR